MKRVVRVGRVAVSSGCMGACNRSGTEASQFVTERAMFILRNDVGRLVEVRVTSPSTLEGVDRFREALTGAVRRHAGTAILCVDLRASRMFSPEVSDRVLEVMKAASALIERNAILLEPDAATFSLQVERMVQESRAPGRQTFRAAHALSAWLAPIITREEHTRLTQFLGESVW